MLQNPKTTECHENRMSIRLVYSIRRFVFIHYQQQTECDPMLTVTVATHQGPNSILRPSSAGFITTLTILCDAVTTHMLELEA